MSRVPDDEQVAELLQRSRPRPRLHFAEELETELFERPAKRSRFTSLRAGLALTGVIAVLLLGFSLVGAGPLAPSGNEGVQADQTCRWVVVSKVERKPRVIRDAQGQERVVTTPHRVKRHVRRCS